MQQYSLRSRKGGGSVPSFLYVLGLSTFLFIPLLFNSLPSDQVFVAIPVLGLAFVLFRYRAHWFPTFLSFGLSIRVLVLSGPLYIFISPFFTSYWPWLSLWMGASFLLFPMSAFAVIELRRISISAFLHGFVFAVAVNVIAIIWLSLEGVMRPSGFLADPNLAANMIALALLSTIYLILSGRGRYILIIQFLLGVGLFLTLSRGALYAFCGASILFFLLLQIKSLSWRITALKTILVLAAAYIAFTFIEMGQASLADLSIGSRPGSWSDRLEMWSSAWEMFVQHPVWGTGLGSFALRYPALRSINETTSVGYFAHNDYLQLLLELGIIGFIAWIFVPLLLVFFACNEYVRSIKLEKLKFLALAISIVAMVAVHSAVNFIIYHPLINIVLGGVLGFVLRDFGSSSDGFHKPGVVAKRSLGAVSLFFLGFGIVLASLVVDVQGRKLVAQSRQQGQGFNLQSELYYDLLPLQYLSPLNIEIKNSLVNAQVNTALNLYPSEVGEGLDNEIKSQVENFAWLQWGNCSLAVDKARLLWLEDKSSAIGVLRDVLSKSPNCIRGRITLAEAYIAESKYPKAINVLNEGVDRFAFRENSGEGPTVLLSTLEKAYKVSGNETSAKAIEAYIAEFRRQRKINDKGLKKRSIDL